MRRNGQQLNPQKFHPENHNASRVSISHFNQSHFGLKNLSATSLKPVDEAKLLQPSGKKGTVDNSIIEQAQKSLMNQRPADIGTVLAIAEVNSKIMYSTKKPLKFTGNAIRKTVKRMTEKNSQIMQQSLKKGESPNRNNYIEKPLKKINFSLMETINLVDQKKNISTLTVSNQRNSRYLYNSSQVKDSSPTRSKNFFNTYHITEYLQSKKDLFNKSIEQIDAGELNRSKFLTSDFVDSNVLLLEKALENAKEELLQENNDIPTFLLPENMPRLIFFPRKRTIYLEIRSFLKHFPLYISCDRTDLDLEYFVSFDKQNQPNKAKNEQTAEGNNITINPPQKNLNPEFVIIMVHGPSDAKCVFSHNFTNPTFVHITQKRKGPDYFTTRGKKELFGLPQHFDGNLQAEVHYGVMEVKHKKNYDPEAILDRNKAIAVYFDRFRVKQLADSHNEENIRYQDNKKKAKEIFKQNQYKKEQSIGRHDVLKKQREEEQQKDCNDKKKSAYNFTWIYQIKVLEGLDDINHLWNTEGPKIVTRRLQNQKAIKLQRWIRNLVNNRLKWKVGYLLRNQLSISYALEVFAKATKIDARAKSLDILGNVLGAYFYPLKMFRSCLSYMLSLKNIQRRFTKHLSLKNKIVDDLQLSWEKEIMYLSEIDYQKVDGDEKEVGIESYLGLLSTDKVRSFQIHMFDRQLLYYLEVRYGYQMKRQNEAFEKKAKILLANILKSSKLNSILNIKDKEVKGKPDLDSLKQISRLTQQFPETLNKKTQIALQKIIVKRDTKTLLQEELSIAARSMRTSAEWNETNKDKISQIDSAKLKKKKDKLNRGQNLRNSQHQELIKNVLGNNKGSFLVDKQNYKDDETISDDDSFEYESALICAESQFKKDEKRQTSKQMRFDEQGSIEEFEESVLLDNFNVLENEITNVNNDKSMINESLQNNNRKLNKKNKSNISIGKKKKKDDKGKKETRDPPTDKFKQMDDPNLDLVFSSEKKLSPKKKKTLSPLKKIKRDKSVSKSPEMGQTQVSPIQKESKMFRKVKRDSKKLKIDIDDIEIQPSKLKRIRETRLRELEKKYKISRKKLFDDKYLYNTNTMWTEQSETHIYSFYDQIIARVPKIYEKIFVASIRKSTTKTRVPMNRDDMEQHIQNSYALTVDSKVDFSSAVDDKCNIINDKKLNRLILGKVNVDDFKLSVKPRIMRAIIISMMESISGKKII